MGYLPYQLVQDFSHQQYHHNPTIAMDHSKTELTLRLTPGLAAQLTPWSVPWYLRAPITLLSWAVQ